MDNLSDTETSKSWEDTSTVELIGDNSSESNHQSEILLSEVALTAQENVKSISKTSCEIKEIPKSFSETTVHPKLSKEIIVANKEGYTDKVGLGEEISQDGDNSKQYTHKLTSEVPSLVCTLPSKEDAIISREKLATLHEGDIENLSYDCSCQKCVFPSLEKRPLPFTKFMYTNTKNEIYHVSKSDNCSTSCPNEKRSKIPVTTNPLLYKTVTCVCSKCRCYHLENCNAELSEDEDLKLINAFFDEEKQKIIAAGGFKPIVSAIEEKRDLEEFKNLCDCQPCMCEKTCGGKKPGCSCTVDDICNSCILDGLKKELEELVTQVQELRKTIPGSFSRIHQGEL